MSAVLISPESPLCRKTCRKSSTDGVLRSTAWNMSSFTWCWNQRLILIFFFFRFDLFPLFQSKTVQVFKKGSHLLQ